MSIKPFPHYQQLDAMDCGPSCLRMIAKYYGRNHSQQVLREQCFMTREGVSMLGISDAAEYIGMRTQGVRITTQQLTEDALMPCILHWNQNHFVVCYRIKKQRSGWDLLPWKRNKQKDNYLFYISDPATGKTTLTQEDFEACWISTQEGEKKMGTALLMEPSPRFYEFEETIDRDEKKKQRLGLSFFFRYLTPHKAQLLQMALGTLLISILQLIFPFLSQTMIDSGVENQNLSLITLILIAQFVLFFTQLGVEFLRSWIILHTTTRINISLVSDFLAKLMRLPMKYFDTKMVGDILQRIDDNDRIQRFLTGSSLNVFFSFGNFIIFSFVLGYYSMTILGIFLLGHALYVLWIVAFLRYRRELDTRRFIQASSEQSNVVEIVTGMQEIKLSNSERQKRWKWERIQIKLFKISMKGLALGQYQQIGSSFFSQSTTLFISYLAARDVVNGSMTLGMLMSISYIIGQLTSPISQFIGFIQSFQDAKISLDRLGEINNREDEDQNTDVQLNTLPDDHAISIRHLWFSYDGADRDYALSDINVEIPQNKTTAIVGASGSGKTTLVKLILGFYPLNKGNILIGKTPLNNINSRFWRSKVGVVMQEGFIFSDTIVGNIAVGKEEVDRERLRTAVTTANIKSYIDNLPLSYYTKIGMEGKGLSQGQKQRLLIARAIYKDPDYLFFDEATNSLDATNEKVIMDNLAALRHKKTMIVVAHRLSTVQNADNIIVLDQGRIVEQGTHEELLTIRGHYYSLIKNQLELGN